MSITCVMFSFSRTALQLKQVMTFFASMPRSCVIGAGAGVCSEVACASTGQSDETSGAADAEARSARSAAEERASIFELVRRCGVSGDGQERRVLDC